MRFNPEAWVPMLTRRCSGRLEPVKAQVSEISYADLYTYSGVVAVEEAGVPS
jgi:catalase (peroxidase I)